MKLKLDLSKGVIEDIKYGGYLIPISTPFNYGDSFSDYISIDKESQSLWFSSYIYSVIRAGWKSEEYQELKDWLNESFQGPEIGTSIIGYIRKQYLDY